MSKYLAIKKEDMVSFLVEKGFKEVEGIKGFEVVYGKLLRRNVCLRVYTSLPKDGDVVRKMGGDAIRLLVVKKIPKGTMEEDIMPLMRQSWRVYRVKGWEKNLGKNIDILEKHYGK